MNYLSNYQHIRAQTVALCRPLSPEDLAVQPAPQVSPPKWHLAHTTWFFETFILQPQLPGYRVFHPDFSYLFNSYYETVGARVKREDRQKLSRPGIDDILEYRAYVDRHMEDFLHTPPDPALAKLLLLGLHHEQQHQELLLMDIKYILGQNPLFPVLHQEAAGSPQTEPKQKPPVVIKEGVYEIGATGDDFCFDNETGRHKVFLSEYAINARLVTNREYLGFIESGGYRDFRYWHADGWEWLQQNQISSPLYWFFRDNEWKEYTFSGIDTIDLNQPVCHVSYYEAAAFAAWAGMRLPTEAEWEVAADRFDWGECWEWTESAYLPYPGFQKAAGAVGEYNGKFMVNQMVLRGASRATPKHHRRTTYRNFFHPHFRWQFGGIRLAQHLPSPKNEIRKHPK